MCVRDDDTHTEHSHEQLSDESCLDFVISQVW